MNLLMKCKIDTLFPNKNKTKKQNQQYCREFEWSKINSIPQNKIDNNNNNK